MMAESIVFECRVESRKDIDKIEEAIRNVRATTSASSTDQLSSGIRRCNVLETQAYLDLRLNLLRHITVDEEDRDTETNNNSMMEFYDDLVEDASTTTTISKTIVCHLGNGISAKAIFFSENSPVKEKKNPIVKILWRHLDNDTPLPHATIDKKCQPIEQDEDDSGTTQQQTKKKKKTKK